MVDKVQKIREEVERIQLYTQSEVLKQVLDYIDEVQKEPVIQNVITEPIGVPTGAVELANIPDKRSPINEEIGDYDHKAVMKTLHPELKEEPVSEELEEVMQRNAPDNIGIDDLLYWRNGFITGTKWQREKGESTTEDLGDYINELSKQFPEVSFAKLSRIAVRVAKWQREQMEKNAFYITCCGAHMFSAIWCIDNMDTSRYKAGDRLKIIIVEED